MSELDRIDDLVRGLPSVEPPAGFADRVVALASMERRAERSRRLLFAALGVDAAVVVALALSFVVSTTQAGVAGAGTTRLGDHAAAVVEPGGELRFTVSDGLWRDRVQVEQPRGRAFYRVEPGNALSVRTPAGDVVVHGTCFSVEVQEDQMIATSTKPFPNSIAATAAGALVGAGLMVVVYEGAVQVTNEHGTVQVGPGERATATKGQAPAVAPLETRRELVRLQQENIALQDALVAARQALAGDPRQLAEANAALSQRLAKAERELAAFEALRAETEGKPVDPPADLPARFSEQALLQAFNSALAQAGLKGDVSHIDCEEYPCIVYGDVFPASDQEAMNLADLLRKTPALAQYASDSDHTSFWRSRKRDKETGTTVDETRFGIALYPKPDDEQGQAIDKRVNYRNNMMFEQMKR